MEAKPIITCHGNQSLFSSLHAAVVHGLPKEVCEWRRSFGRAPRSVQLEGSFVPYDADILPEEDTKTLVSRPYFHIYWTDCDLDGYKQSVRDDISEWQAALKARNIPDWLVVVVIPDESKVKAKLLPRSSVIDKVRNDFCSKQPERSIVLTEPSKTEPKSQESWNQFFQKLRVLLLQAYNRHLNKYEENMRTLREKRNEAGWSYFDYFAVQEELGFMLEILGLREDALIQYDELDAMFDQFVENHAGGDAVKWLSPLLQPCSNWTGLSLAKPIDLDLRDRIKRTMISLLEFRNYLFCRQAALLFSMGRAWEVAERAFEFLQNTVTEMKALEVELPEGALQCWVVLSGLEVLAACQKHETGQVDKCSIFTAHLWDHIRGKLKEMGQLCSLMPGMVPTSAQLNQVLDLKGGMVVSQDQETVGDTRPVDKLHEALSSPAAFKKHYLEMCELAMGTYKHISRFRSSRKIGRELASFYMNIGEPQKAEAFLLDAVKMYRQEGWNSLAHSTMRELAACQRQMGHTKRFLVTACKVACSSYLPEADRNQHFTAVLKALDSGNSMQLTGQNLIEATLLQLNQPTVRMGEEVTMTIQLHSHFPQALSCDSVHLALSPRPTQQLEHALNDAQEQQPPVQFQGPQSVTINTETPPPSRVLRQSFPSKINTRALYERRQGRVAVAGITCDSAHELLKRKDSMPTGAETSDVPVKGDYSWSLCATKVTLKPGLNLLELRAKIGEEGWFGPSQICVSVKGLEVLISLTNINMSLHVASYRPSFTLTPKKTEEFIAGIEQTATLTIQTGNQTMGSGVPLTLTSALPVTFTPIEADDGQLWLPAQEPHSSVDIDINVYLPLEGMTASEGTCLSLNPKVECHVEGWSESLQGHMTVVIPLCASHRVYTARNKKYVQVKLKGNTTTPIRVTQPDLSAFGATFTFLNDGKEWVVRQKQDVSLVWEILAGDSNEDEDVNAAFHCSFDCDQDLSRQHRPFTYNCCLSEFQTWYMVEYTLSGEGTITATVPGTQLSSKSMRCAGYQSGITYTFFLTITPVNTHCSAPRPQHLVYRVTADPSIWAFSGKTTGVLSIGENPFRASLKVIPLAAGYQHLPKVQLYHHPGTEAPAAVDSEDVWVKRAKAESSSPDLEEESPSNPKDSDSEETLDVSSGLRQFNVGRVYNACLAKQVHVFPTPASSDMEVSMETTCV